MAAQKYLNPQAPEYIPISHKPTSHSVAPSLHLQIHHLFPTPHSPPPLPYFSTLPPFYTQPHYPKPYPIHPHHPNLFKTPPPPPAVAPPPPPPIRHPPTTGSPEKPRVSRSGKKEGFGERERGRKKNGKPNSKACRMVVASRRILPKKTQRKVFPLNREEEKTTVMIKNIPNKYTRELLLKLLDKHCMLENRRKEDVTASKEGEEHVCAFDFMYLPMDFRTGVNKGYAFVNFINPRDVWKFYEAFNKKEWELFGSPKICEIVCAKLQGKEALVNHFMKSIFTCESDEFLPACFSPPRDGSGKSVKLSTVGTRTPRVRALAGKPKNITKSGPCAQI